MNSLTLNRAHASMPRYHLTYRKEASLNLANLLSRKTPFFYGWVILATSGSTQVVRNAAASLTLAVFMYPMADDLGWSRTVLAGAASAGGLASSFLSPATGLAVD